MSTSIEASKRIVEETKRLYSNILKQELDERQLARPSFKFIFELVKSLISETRLLRDVFNLADFDQANKRTRTLDRRAKVEFVQQLIDFAANNKQPIVSCVAARVVAGLEPNKTNELLQALARIAQIKLSSASDGRRPRTYTKKQQQQQRSVGGQKLSSKANSGLVSASQRLNSGSSKALPETETSTRVQSGGGANGNLEASRQFTSRRSVAEPPQSRSPANSSSPGVSLSQTIDQSSASNHKLQLQQRQQQQQQQLELTSSEIAPQAAKKQRQTTSNESNNKKLLLASNSSANILNIATGTNSKGSTGLITSNFIGGSSESDIQAKNIQLVRQQLKALCSTLANVKGMEKSLRDSLMVYLEQEKQDAIG